MRESLVKLSGLLNYVAKMVTGCLKNNKICYICSIKLKGLLVRYEKYGTLSIYEWFLTFPLAKDFNVFK